MYLILLGLQILLILINLAGLGVVTNRFIPDYGLAKPVGVLIVCMVFFFVEHFIGLGSLTWLWPITTLASGYALYRKRELIRREWLIELVFILGFCYTLLWRGGFPDIYPTSERVTDLYFISNYLNGSTLPPLDNWLPPFRFNIYYAFQHYAAALFGRLFGLDGGTTYNLAYCLIMAFSISLAWFFVTQICSKKSARILVILAFVMGGTGVSPLVHFLIDEQKLGQPTDLWASMRFAGDYDKRINTDFGKKLFHSKSTEEQLANDSKILDLPVETFSYQFFVGDYHPPLGSFFLLLLSLALMAVLENQKSNRIYQGLLGLTVPAVLVTNTWLLPFQVLLVAGWLIYRYLVGNRSDWKAVVAGALGGSVLILPFLAGFAPQAQATPIRWISGPEHTPFAQFIALHWPLMVLSLLAIIGFRDRRFASFVGIMVLATLLISECVFVDDLTADEYQRTNTTMKWWSWIYAMAVVGLGALNLTADRKSIRYITIATLLLLLSYSFDLCRSWVATGKDSAGRLNGHRWLSQDPTNREMLIYLAASPFGIVMENVDKFAYSNTTTFALFSNKPALLGWPSHLATWRGSPLHSHLQFEQIKRFYEGTKDNPLVWLQQNGVRYIVWKSDDNKSDFPKAYETIQSQIGSQYNWKPFYDAGSYVVGIWVAKSADGLSMPDK